MIGTTISIDEIANCPIFSGMNRDELVELVNIASVETFRPNQVVLDQGKASQNLWVILNGNCQVVRLTGDRPPYPVDLADLGPQDHFGEMSFFHAAPHSASVQAITDLRVLRIERAAYDQLINNGSEAAYRLALNSSELLADRLRRMDDWVTELVCGMNDNNRTQHEWERFRERLFVTSSDAMKAMIGDGLNRHQC
jgi:CRP-like cAMP-binding protein